jgi:hypothetical protein
MDRRGKMSRHLDLTITRDKVGGTPRRVAFTCSATGYVDGTDGIDVSPNSLRMRCKVYKSANQTLSSGAQPALSWDSEAFDVGPLHDVVTTNSRITIPTGGDTGAWWITAQVKWVTNANSYRIIRLLENGVVLAQNIIKPTGLIDEAQSVFAVVDAPAVGTYYEVDASQVTGGNLDVIGGTVFSSFFSAVHVW